jgi:chitodextrinase
VGVAGYGIYLAGVRIASASSPGYTIAALTCGTTYTVGVDAYDAVGSRSAQATLVVATRACPVDAEAPTVPQNQTLAGITQSSFTMSWSAATDNVGVVGYAVYLDSARRATTTGTSYTYTGLACGTTYTVGLEAVDAAGNFSDVRFATGPAATVACSPSGDTQAPTVPAGMTSGSVTQSSVSVSWSASSDNVAVAGYGYYRAGSLVGNGSGTGYTFTGLACATTYSFAVDAYDVAGNRSSKASVTASTSACSTTPPPAAGSASVWVDPSGGSCARFSFPAAYADAQACATLQAAYNVAQAGDIVGIVDGTYAGQTLAAGTKSVAFRAVGPGRPSFGHFVSAASNVSIAGVLIEDRSERTGTCETASYGVLVPCGANQTYDNIVVDGLNTGDKHGVESPGRGLRLLNSEVRNIRDQKGFEGGADDMVIEKNYWHDITVRTEGVHNECMFINGGSRSVYRGNLFVGCPTMAMFFTNWNGGAPYGDVTIENNILGHTTTSGGGWHAGPALLIGSGYNNQNTLYGWIVRYNTFETGVLVDDLPGGSSSWYGNVGGVDCVRAFTYHHNVGGTCGGTGDLSVSPATNSATSPNQVPFYVNAPAGDFHLKAGTVPINKADPANHPATDRDGVPRTDGAPDAGAYEYRP